jgi:hypothetical protein
MLIDGGGDGREMVVVDELVDRAIPGPGADTSILSD